MGKIDEPKGFTLLELIVVVIIISILATLGFVVYTELMERARDAEAINILKAWMDAIDIYYLEHGTVEGTTVIANLTPVPGGCSPNYYFRYVGAAYLTCSEKFAIQIVATRCTANGKPPQSNVRYVYLEKNFADNTTRIGKSPTWPTGVVFECPP
jgi:prepilin-type N-terminal cleavage/methylation domain-containing protein